MNKQEVFMKNHLKLLLQRQLHKKQFQNKLCLQVVRRQHVGVLHLQKLEPNVIVRCMVLVYVMQHVVVMLIFVKNKSVK